MMTVFWIWGCCVLAMLSVLGLTGISVAGVRPCSSLILNVSLLAFALVPFPSALGILLQWQTKFFSTVDHGVLEDRDWPVRQWSLCLIGQSVTICS